jgi:hypothetical protein
MGQSSRPGNGSTAGLLVLLELEAGLFKLLGQRGELGGGLLEAARS